MREHLQSDTVVGHPWTSSNVNFAHVADLGVHILPV